MDKEKIIINPKTKVLQLIETYPELEAIIIEYLPAFSKLDNPILRNSVAKVTTLQQAASIGKVKVEELINHLRREVGQELVSESFESVYNTKRPEWFDEDIITEEFDIREMLSEGEHPVNHVMAELGKLKEGKIYGIIAPFLPAPLIDKTQSIQFAHWIVEEAENIYKIYFKKV